MRITLLANGIRDDIPLEDAHAIAAILVAQRKTIPPERWVDDMADEMEANALGAFGAWSGG